MARVFISATHKSSGKTIVSVGLCAALKALGLAVQPFKKGPDFIDPLWLSAAAGRSCRNLDHHTMSDEEILATVATAAATADVAVIEANKGLYDGVATDGRDSGAALARLLRAPVVLVLDCEGMTRGVAPLLLGYRAFDPGLLIAGVVFNKVAGPRHEAKLRAAVATYTDLPVLGALHRAAALEIKERHLGLTPANEATEAAEKIEAIAALVAAQIDFPAVLAHAAAAPPLAATPYPAASAWQGPRRRIGFASDRAFGFYYPEDLESLAAAGCDLVPFDTLRDRRLPRDLDGLFLGGGFPEMHMDALEANAELRSDVRDAVRGGLPTYAECGGMMYLCRSIRRDGECRTMAGAIEADAVMHARPQGKGYVVLEELDDAPWPGRSAEPIRAHEFHYAAIDNIAPNTRFAYRVIRGHGITGRHDGIVTHRTLASFSHLRGVGRNPWPRRYAAYVHRTSADRTTLDASGSNRANAAGSGESGPRRRKAIVLSRQQEEENADVQPHYD